MMKLHKLQRHSLPRLSKNIQPSSPLRRKIHRRSRPRRHLRSTKKHSSSKLPIRRNAPPPLKIPPQNNRQKVKPVNMPISRSKNLVNRPNLPQHLKIPAQSPRPMIVGEHPPSPHSAKQKSSVRVMAHTHAPA